MMKCPHATLCRSGASRVAARAEARPIWKNREYDMTTRRALIKSAMLAGVAAMATFGAAGFAAAEDLDTIKENGVIFGYTGPIESLTGIMASSAACICLASSGLPSRIAMPAPIASVSRSSSATKS